MRTESASTQLKAAGGSGVYATWLPLAVLCLLAVLIRLPGLDHLPVTPFADELYTLLAARGWLAEGVPKIAEGVYTRAELFTVLIAQTFRLFGESLLVARLPSFIAGSLLVVAVFLWTRAVAGPLAAWIAALFVALSPLEIQASQFARFYTLFGLLFWLGTTGVYAAAEHRFASPRAWLVAGGAALALLVSLHLHVLTLMGLVGLAAWLFLAEFLPRLPAGRIRALGGAGTVVLALVAVLVFLETGAGRALIEEYRQAPLHSREHVNEVWFYHLAFIERYPSLWPITPFAALIALAARPRPSLFCLVVFAVAFVLLSFGGMKDFLFALFVLPFLFVLWAIALARVLPFLWQGLIATVDRVLAGLAPGLPRRPARWVVLTASLLFLVLANGAPARTLLKPLGFSLDPAGAPVDWMAASAALKPWLEQEPVVLAGNDLPILYYLGDYDVTVNANLMSEVGTEEFGRDRRTGLPVVSTAESVRLMIECFPSGLFVTDLRNWRADAGVRDEVADLIEARSTPIDMPAAWGVRAFHWQHPDQVPPTEECLALKASLAPSQP